MKQVERWLGSYEALGTRERYSRALSKFCAYYKVTPEGTLDWDLERIEDNMIDWKVFQRNEGFAGSTIIVEFAAVKRWFIFNRKRISVECKNISTTRKMLDYIPTRSNIQEMLDSAKLSHRVAIAIFAFAGYRPIDISELKYKHVKASLEAGDEVLTIIKQHRKTRQWYVTFLGPQGTRYLRSYLKIRRMNAEIITDETPIMIGNKGLAMSADAIGSSIYRIILRTIGRYPTGESFRRFRPYSLRKYFRRAMNQLGDAIAEYLMGHREGLQGMPATYGGLADLDPIAVDRLKKDYTKMLGELETEVSDTTLRAQLEEKEKKQEAMLSDLGRMKGDIKDLRDFVKQLKDQEKG